MGDTFTEDDMRSQIIGSLGGDTSRHDVPAILAEIQSAYGTVPIEEVPAMLYWNVIERHQKAAIGD